MSRKKKQNREGVGREGGESEGRPLVVFNKSSFRYTRLWSSLPIFPCPLTWRCTPLSEYLAQNTLARYSVVCAWRFGLFIPQPYAVVKMFWRSCRNIASQTISKSSLMATQKIFWGEFYRLLITQTMKTIMWGAETVSMSAWHWKVIATFSGGNLTFILLSVLKVQLNRQQKTCNLSCNIAAKRVE